MGFLDFLKKNQPAPATQADLAPTPPPSQETPFGTEMLDEHPPAPDTYLSDLAEHHDPADDLFSPTPAPAPLSSVRRSADAISAPTAPTAATMPVPSAQFVIPDELFAPPRTRPEQPTAAPEQPITTSAKPAVPVAKPKSLAVSIPDFTEEDIEALERLQHAPALSVIGMDAPAIMGATFAASGSEIPVAPVQRTDAWSAPPTEPALRASLVPESSEQRSMPAHPLPDLPKASPLPVTTDEMDGFLSAEGYLGITDDIRASRRGLRRCDDAIRDALSQHGDLDLQYARAASDIASIEERLRSLDTALFGE